MGLLVTTVIGLLNSNILLLAHGGDKKHKESEHGNHTPEAGKFLSVGAAWEVVQKSTKEIESGIASQNQETIHEAEENLSGGLIFLQSNSALVTGDKAKRLEAALKQAISVSSNVHEAADAKDMTKAAVEFKKLQGALKLIEAQYPPDALKAPMKTTAAQTHCPVSTRPLGSMGDPVAYEHKDGVGSRTIQFCCSGCAPKFKANPTVYLKKLDEMAHGSEGHQHGSSEPSMKLSVFTAKPLQVGKKADVTVQLKTLQGKPVNSDDLMVAHEEKIHLLLIDSSLTDYHHEHPVSTDRPGEYSFSFTPQKPGSYRIWADLVAQSTGMQEYVIADLPASSPATPMIKSNASLVTEVDGLTYTITFNKPVLKKGEAALGTLTITDKSGKIFNQLEPLMGAYAHLVGFGEDRKTIAHIHPMGAEPTKNSDRGNGQLKFHLQPDKAGTMKLFAQVQIGGVSKFAPFILEINS